MSWQNSSHSPRHSTQNRTRQQPLPLGREAGPALGEAALAPRVPEPGPQEMGQEPSPAGSPSSALPGPAAPPWSRQPLAILSLLPQPQPLKASLQPLQCPGTTAAPTETREPRYSPTKQLPLLQAGPGPSHKLSSSDKGVTAPRLLIPVGQGWDGPKSTQHLCSDTVLSPLCCPGEGPGCHPCHRGLAPPAALPARPSPPRPAGLFRAGRAPCGAPGHLTASPSQLCPTPTMSGARPAAPRHG